MSLDLVRLSLTQANEHVAAWHRHNDPVEGHLWSTGAVDGDGILRAVAIIGRPVAKSYDDGDTVEVLRIASDGTRNCNSFLYGAAARAAFGQGYHRVYTYIEKAEGGASLRAAGYRLVAERPARKGWHTASRPRDNRRYRSVARQLWEAAPCAESPEGLSQRDDEIRRPDSGSIRARTDSAIVQGATS